MKKRALLFTIQSNFVEKLDQNVIATGLKLLDYETTVLTKKEFVDKSKELDFSEFDAIFFPVQFSAMYSSTQGYFEAIEKLMNEARDGSLYTYVCDTSLVPNPHLWKYGDKEYKSRQNLYAKRPVTHLACFKDAILKDEQAMNRLHNLWMKRNHPESKLYMLEWTSFYYYCQNSLESMTASTVGIDDLVDYSCNLLYYGGDKPKIARRLKELGIEKDPNNLVFGTIGKILPNVRQVLPKMSVNGYDWKSMPKKQIKLYSHTNLLKVIIKSHSE